MILRDRADLAVIYFFFPETARLTLEEIAQKFGEEVAVHITDAPDEEKARIERNLASKYDDGSGQAQTQAASHGDSPSPDLSADGVQEAPKMG